MRGADALATRRGAIGQGRGWGLYLEVSLMATATVGVVPAKSPANSGEIPRRRRGYDEDRDDEAKARVRSVRAGEVRIDGER